MKIKLFFIPLLLLTGCATPLSPQKHEEQLLVEDYGVKFYRLKMEDGTYIYEQITSIKDSLIRDACRGSQKTAGKFIWKYKTL